VTPVAPRLEATTGFGRFAGRYCGAAAVFFWAVFSAAEAGSWGYALRWLHANDELEASLAISRMPSVCGVALWGVAVYDTGGYAYMHFRGGIYLPKTVDALAKDTAKFNTLLYYGTPPEGLGYTKTRCFGSTCIAQRPGSCEAEITNPTPEIPPMLHGIEPEGGG